MPLFMFLQLLLILGVIMEYGKQDTLLFFERHEGAYPLYEALEKALTERFPLTEIKVQRSQISFYNRHMYACVSFARVKRKSELPPEYIVLTFGLPYPLESRRVAVKTQPYPGRWTTYIMIDSQADIDPELMGWMEEAYDSAQNK